jgi:hypothetical protein
MPAITSRRLGEGSADFGSFTAFSAPDLGLKFCHPADWQEPTEDLPGLFRGMVGPDGDRGVYLLRMGLTGTVRSSQTVSEDILHIAVTSFQSLLPGSPATYRDDVGTTHEQFLNLASPTNRWYDYGTGQLRADAALAGDGSAVIAIVFGPYDWIAEGQDEWGWIHRSLVFSE